MFQAPCLSRFAEARTSGSDPRIKSEKESR